MASQPIKMRREALNPAERDRLIRARLDADENEKLATLGAIDNSAFIRARGRPPLHLRPDVARMILDDVKTRMPLRAIEAKYRPYFPVSCRTLDRWLKDGRLERMAAEPGLSAA